MKLDLEPIHHGHGYVTPVFGSDAVGPLDPEHLAGDAHLERVHAVHGEQEWRDEIRPKRLAVEIGAMDRVPGRVHLMTGKRIPGRASFRYDRTVELLDGDPVRREHRALIGCPIRLDRRALLVQPHGHPAWRTILHQSFEREKATAGDDRSLYLRLGLPAFHATMRLDDFGKEMVHQNLSGKPDLQERKCVPQRFSSPHGPTQFQRSAPALASSPLRCAP